MSPFSSAAAVPSWSVRRALALGAIATLAACADSSTAPRTALSPSAANNSRADIAAFSAAAGPEWRRILPTREFNSNDRASKAAFSLATLTNVRYHGGPVLRDFTNVAVVYWGSPDYKNRPTLLSQPASGSGADDHTLIGTFLRVLGGSRYFNINTTYTDGSGIPIKNVVNYTQYWDNTATPPSSPTDANIVAMLQTGISSGAIAYDPNTLYAVLTGSGINLGGGFGTQYCAYHTHGTVTVNGAARTILYAAMPYNYQYPSACTSGKAPANGSLDPAADYEVNTLAHETEETTTDELGNAWYDYFGYENADKCAWTWGTTSTDPTTNGVYNVTMTDAAGTAYHFLIQQNWIRTSPAHCAQGL